MIKITWHFTNMTLSSYRHCDTTSGTCLKLNESVTRGLKLMNIRVNKLGGAQAIHTNICLATSSPGLFKPWIQTAMFCNRQCDPIANSWVIQALADFSLQLILLKHTMHALATIMHAYCLLSAAIYWTILWSCKRRVEAWSVVSCGMFRSLVIVPDNNEEQKTKKPRPFSP